LQNPKVSVLLIVKNALPLLVGALNSLKLQTFKDFEIIAADGGSSDGTLDVLHQARDQLPLRIASESDHSLADGAAKTIPHTAGDIIGTLCADERYYPKTLEQVVRWFAAEPGAVMCGGRVDFVDECGKVIDSHLTAPFNLSAHLACEVVPSDLTSFFNRRMLGEDFHYDTSVPTCPDYEFWARLGLRFPASAFKRYDVSVAQAYRTRDSMSFRAESFAQFCHDKLTHLNNLLAKGYIRDNAEAVRRRSSAGIHMWAAEQLSYVEHNHPDILAHCAAAAAYDRAYERIGRFVAATGKARYDAASGTVTRIISDKPGPRVSTVGEFTRFTPTANADGATILEEKPLTVRTGQSAWGYSMEISKSRLRAVKGALRARFRGGQFWGRLDLEVIEGCVGIGKIEQEQNLVAEQVFRQSDGRTVAFIALGEKASPATRLMVRSGGHPSSVLRLYSAELLHDPERNIGVVAPIE